MGIYVFDSTFLARTLQKDAFSNRSSHDFGKDILPSVLHQARVYAYSFNEGSSGTSYWRDVGTPAAYWRANLELLDDAPGLQLDDTAWPLRCAGRTPALTHCFANSDAEARSRSIVADHCAVGGILRRSVLFNGVHVADGSVVDSSVLLPGSAVGRNCHLFGVIVDSDCRVPDGTVIGGREPGITACHRSEPIIVTARDFAPVTLHACA